MENNLLLTGIDFGPVSSSSLENLKNDLLFLSDLNYQIKLDFSSNSEKLGRVIDNSMIS
ncbi:hypothetical protein [Streptococcus sp. Marseille-Q8145]